MNKPKEKEADNRLLKILYLFALLSHAFAFLLIFAALIYGIPLVSEMYATQEIKILQRAHTIFDLSSLAQTNLNVVIMMLAGVELADIVILTGLKRKRIQIGFYIYEALLALAFIIAGGLAAYALYVPEMLG